VDNKETMTTEPISKLSLSKLNPSKLSRRDFLKASAASVGTLVVSTALTGCGSDSDPLEVPVPAQPPAADFNHGVASGDPLQDKVILWTRVSAHDTALSTVDVSWEVAMDKGFTNFIGRGNTTAIVESDFTVKIDMQGLTAGTVYYYRFKALGAISAVGRTKTLPANDVTEVKMAVVSCSNYPAGYFNVYNEIGKRDDLDVVLHLGDYIYEFGMGGFGTTNSEAIGRALPQDNANEIISLTDYRKRYALYRGDTSAQLMHQSAPFISVWDDHEVANNSWTDGAENHDASEGDFNARKTAALQAYFEWMPIRPASIGDNETIFRQFEFGQLISLYMLDARMAGRDKGLEYADFIDPVTGGLDGAGFQAAIGDPSRTMLGTEQLQWLQGSMAMSTATWQVLGQQLLMGRMLLPVEILPYLATGGPQVVPLLTELSNIKKRMKLNDPTVTAAERARVETVAPWSLDAWDGYFVEREILLGTVASLQKNLVVLAGDTHNSWANNLKDMQGNAVGVEFAVTSVTSDGLSDSLDISPGAVGSFESIIRLLVDDLKYVNLGEKGYMVMTFTEQDAVADWHYIDNITSTDYSVSTSRHHALRMRSGVPELTWV
jgi:alkaline phosphatase D